ncbi:MAG: 30S ribosomal protein S7 [Candidatus Parcubacteria bacterium]|nr:30S ribosomal protein S7 [Candidatus Parcubacteria bacterium]
MRGKPAPKRPIITDPKYNNATVAKFINYIMDDGKKNIAQSIVYGAMDLIAEKTKKNPLEVFEGALKNVTPLLEVRSRRVGGANYQIPYPVRGTRKHSLTFRWVIAAAKARKGLPMKKKLALELMDAYNKEGAAIRKREDVHRMAEANKAFAHFAR